MLQGLDSCRRPVGCARSCTLNSSSNLPITLLKLKLEKAHCNSDIYMSRATQMYKKVGEVKPKDSALRHLEVETVLKCDEHLLESSRFQCRIKAL